MTKNTNHNFKPVIGLEIHAELKTKSKMFCGCKNDPFGAPKPNLYTCPVCLGMPGALPVANKTAIEWTIKLGLALNCQINLFSKFDRKNYFYADLAKGYQISQYDIPFCYGGFIDTSEGRIGITRIHLEEDTGKLQHKTVAGQEVSLIDFNRSGVPLVEIVTEPDIKTATQAAEYGRKLRQIIRFLEIGDCDMEQGGMRLEANISLSSNPEVAVAQQKGQPLDLKQLPNYKVEVKNINSFRFLEQAIEFEIQRQVPILQAGETPAQETRGFDAVKGQTFTQRSKEEAADYRYFPDPDIPPIRFTKEQVAAIKNSLPELPTDKQQRWQKDYQLDEYNALQLSKNKKLAEWAELIWQTASKQKIKPNEIAKALVNKKIKFETGDDPLQLIKSFQAISQNDTIDNDLLFKLVKNTISANPDAVAKYKAGKTQTIGFLIGQVMKELKKKVDIKLVKHAIEQTLSA